MCQLNLSGKKIYLILKFDLFQILRDFLFLGILNNLVRLKFYQKKRSRSKDDTDEINSAILSVFQTSFPNACIKFNVIILRHPSLSGFRSHLGQGSPLYPHIRASSTPPCICAFISLLSVVTWWMDPSYRIKCCCAQAACIYRRKNSDKEHIINQLQKILNKHICKAKP